MTAPDLRSATKQAVNQYLQSLFAMRIKEASRIHPAYKLAWQNIANVSQGGKGFRPYLVVASYGKLDEIVVPIAAAQELLHIAILMHDDVIDQDTIRRGKQNINGLYLGHYGKFLDAAEARHYAYSVGVLSGDALLSEAYLAINNSLLPEPKKRLVTSQLQTAIFEVIGGELLDVEATFIKEEPYDPMTIYRYKTASYSFIRPLMIGALCNGTSQEDTATLHDFGMNAGIGFQLQDDLLGVFGSEQQTGKSALTDLREAKATYLIKAYSKNIVGAEKALFSKTFGNACATNEELDALKQRIAQSGAKEKVEEQIDRYYSLAATALQQLSNATQANELRQLLMLLRARRS